MTDAGDHAYLSERSLDQFGALLFELASQLHVERQRRIALEALLTRSGLIEPDALDGLADDKVIVEVGRNALDDALGRMMRIVSQSGGPQDPLRQDR